MGDQAMFAPDGTVRMVPADQVQAAIGNRGEIAHQMRAPDGSNRWVRTSELGQALKAGGIPFTAMPRPGVPAGLQGPPTQTFSQQHPYVSAVANGASNLLQGVGEGALQTVYHGGDLIRRATGMNRIINDTGVQNLITPENTTQKIGSAVEQAGEMYATGGLLRSLVSKAGLTGATAALTRMGLEGANVGANSAMHGQDVAGGVAIGGVTAGMGELAAMIAPRLAEAALGTKYSERMYGRNPGATIIGNTTGTTPDAIASSAKQTSLNMVSALEQSANAAAQRGVMVSTKPALDILDREIATATRQNNAGLVSQLNEARKQLTERFATGQPIPQTISPTELLDLKRGLGDTITSWGKIPERQGVSGVLKQAYHALDGEFDRAVPEAAKTNQTVSTLIGIVRDAQRKALAPGIMQNVTGRMMAHTGALTTAVAGGYEGRRYGAPGVIGGAIAGAVIPEALARPTTVMALARAASGASKPVISNAGVPALIKEMLLKSH